MRKTIFFLSVLVIAALVSSTCFAGLINYERRNKTQNTTTTSRTTSSYQKPAMKAEDSSSNKYGTSTEISMNRDKPVTASMPAWMKTPPRVRNSAEKKFDSNRNGTLESAEVAMLLKDAVSTINSRGSVSISSDILKEYDRNGDGTINRYEALSITEDLGK